MLGLSDRACDCRNTRHQCTDYVCWRQCKNCGAFLPRTPGEVLLGHLRAAENVPHVKPLHLQEPLTDHGTEGGRAEKEEEEGGYITERGEDRGEDGGEGE